MLHKVSRKAHEEIHPIITVIITHITHGQSLRTWRETKQDAKLLGQGQHSVNIVFPSSLAIHNLFKLVGK